MTAEFKAKFPNWVYGDEDYTLCLSDDIDSLVACTAINVVKNWEVGHFYDFHNMYSTDSKDTRKAVGVDIAIQNGRTFDNHTVRLSKYSKVNPMSANPNVVYDISRENYNKKYALSTALLIWSLYDLDLPSTDDGKMMLMSIDSSFKGFYSGFKSVQTAWLEKMGLEEMIYLQERHRVEDFVEVKRRFKSSEKIYIDDNGILQSDMQLAGISDLLEMEIVLPDVEFDLRKQFDRSSIELNPNREYSNFMIEEKYQPFSMALTSKNTLQMTKF